MNQNPEQKARDLIDDQLTAVFDDMSKGIAITRKVSNQMLLIRYL